MQLYGFALLPAQEIQEQIIDFQKQFQHEIYGPSLGLDKNLPHTSILQHPYYPDMEPQQYFHDITKPISTTFSKVYYQPLNWIFAGVHNEPTLMNYHYDLFLKTKHLIDRKQIDHSKDTKGLTLSEKENYHKYGYRYLKTDFRPHITLGVTDNKDKISDELIQVFDAMFANKPVFYDRIVFYKAGEYGACAEILATKKLA